MPFVSQAQRKWMWANKPEMAKEWESVTPKGAKLPEHVKEGQMAFDWFIKESQLQGVATVAVLRDGKMLWGKRRDNGKWTNPGGHLEAGEDPVAGAHREVLEEAGLKIKNLKMVGQRKITTKTGKELMIHSFTAEPVGKNTSMKEDPDQEVHRWHWVDISKGLPKEQADNLHSPDNVLLQGMGLQEMKKEAKIISRKHLMKFTHGKTHGNLFKGFVKKAALFSKPTLGQKAMGAIKEHGTHAAELAGLGALAYHPIKTLRNPNASEHEKSVAKWETGGLGVLAAPSVGHFAKRLMKK